MLNTTNDPVRSLPAIEDAMEELEILLSAWVDRRRHDKPAPILHKAVIMAAQELVAMTEGDKEEANPGVGGKVEYVGAGMAV